MLAYGLRSKFWAAKLTLALVCVRAAACWRGNPTSCEATPIKPASGVRPGYDPSHPHQHPHPSPSPPSGPPHPQLPFKGVVPVSGWAALVTTLGGVQYDNFELIGRAAGGGGAVAPCGTGAPTAGDAVVATPCDAPHAQTAWAKLPSGELQLRSTTLCIGSGGVLVPCAGEAAGPPGTAAAVAHDRNTGRITTSTGSCLDVPGFPGQNGVQWPHAVTNATCATIPADSQQFQYHPGTGALRPKASMCVQGFGGTVNQYRDCCLSVCT